jgi:hypothetical protein
VKFPIDYSFCYHLRTAPYLSFVVGSRPVFSRGETRMRMDFVVLMVLGGTLTKFLGPVLMILQKNRFEVRFLLA